MSNMASASKRARVTVTDRDHETDEESEVCVTAGVEKRGKALKKSAFQKCRDEYFQNWPFLKPSTKGEGMIYCKLCDRHFSIRHGGAYDCERHIAMAVHKGNAKDVMPCKTIAAHFAQIQQSDAVKQADSIMNAEIGMAEMIAELNLPLSTADAMVQFFKNSFPDSKIAQGMQCGRSKTTAIVKHLAATAKLTLSDRMRTGPFSISTDGSNDADAKKFPIVVRTFNEETGQVCSELLAMPVCQGSASGENIFSLLHAAVMEARAPWTNCIALGVDNANVMTGANKGVYHFVKEKHDHVFLAGCTLHIVHNAARKAAEHLPNFDEILLDVYHYFNKSSSRQDRFKGDQELCGLEEKRMLKHVCTRWLSITRCLERMLKNWDALKVFFSEEKKAKQSSYAQQKVESIFQFIRSPTNKLFGFFLKYVHKEILEGVLVLFQSEEPQIHLLQPHLKKLLRRIMTCFVCNNHIRGKDVTQILYKDPNNQKNNELVMIGDEARYFLKQKEENRLRDSRIYEFFNTVRSYYQTLCDYLLQKLPLEDPVLQHASVVDVDKKDEQSPGSLSFFLDRYPCLLPPGAKKQQIMQQFNEYQCCDLSSCKKIRVDETWTAIGQQRDETGELAFKELSQVMLGILVVPHSSAHCERVFSCVCKNKTDQRSSLSNDILESLLVLKSRTGIFGQRNYSQEQLKAVKSAYKISLTS